MAQNQTSQEVIITHYAHYEMGKKPTKGLPQEGLTELLQAGYQGKLSTPRTPLGDIMDINTTEQALKLQTELAGIAADLGAAAKRQTAHPRCAGQRKRATDRAHPCRCGRCRQGARRSGATLG